MAVAVTDGGYSWVVLASSAFISFAVSGIARSYGVIYVAILNESEVSRQQASWPGTVSSAANVVSGLLGSLLIQHTSIRKASCLASFIASAGLISCYFTDSIIWTTVGFGVVYGIGIGIFHTVLTVAITKFFKRHRTTALGILVAGVPANSMLFPPFMEFLLGVYDLHGLFLILGGISLNAIPASMLIREPQENDSGEDATIPEDEDGGTYPKAKSLEEVCLSTLGREAVYAEGQATPNIEESCQHYCPNSPNRRILKTLPSDHDVECASRKPYEEPEVLPFLKADDSSTGSKFTGTGRHKHLEFRASSSSRLPVQDRPGSGKQGLSKKDNEPHLQQAKRLFTRHSFYAILVSTIVFQLNAMAFLNVIVDYAEDKGLSEIEAISVLSALSVFDVVSRCALGWITDRRYVTAKNGFILNMTVIGLLCQVYPHANGVIPFAVLSCVFGVFLGNTVSLSLSVIPECLGESHLAFTVGLISSAYGMFSFSRPSIVGLFRDDIGSYDWMIRTMGFFHLAANLLWLLERLRTRKNAGTAPDAELC